MIKIYLGCGQIPKEGFINVDRRKPTNLPEGTEFLEADAFDIGMHFEPETVDLIRAEMLLEHVPQVLIPELLYQFWNVLKPGGRLELLTPDFLAIAREAVKMEDEKSYDRTKFEKMAQILMNSFAGMGFEDCHKALISRAYLQDILESEGFTDIKFKNTGTYGWGLIAVAKKGEHVDRPSLRDVEYSIEESSEGEKKK